MYSGINGTLLSDSGWFMLSGFATHEISKSTKHGPVYVRISALCESQT